MNSIISRKKKIGAGRILLMVFAFSVALLQLFSFNAVSFVFWACFGISASYTTGAELDLASKTYRVTKFVLGIKYGEWKPNPKFEYVSVFKTKQTQTVNYASISTDTTSGIIVLNVFYGNKHLTFYETSDKADAFENAKHIAIALDIDVLDATTRDKVWLNQYLQPI